MRLPGWEATGSSKGSGGGPANVQLRDDSGQVVLRAWEQAVTDRFEVRRVRSGSQPM